MENKNGFSFGDSSKNYETEKLNSDYLELLSETPVSEEEVYGEESRDIYSSSDKGVNTRSFKDDYEDVYSDSSKERDDIYVLTDDAEEYEDVYSNGDIYLSKKPVRAEDYEEDDYEDIPITQKNRRNMQKQITMELPDDEISDYEMRRGKTLGNKENKLFNSKLKVAILAVVAVIVAFSIVLVTSAGAIVSSFTKGEKVEHISDVSSLAKRSDVKNILFIGADNAKGGTSRSDSMMIISVNKKAGKVIITSILRDTHVDIPGECEAKINSAYSWGGANLLIQTIEQNFNLKIDGYAVVDFNMFTELVDGLGGVDVEVTENEADYINNRHNYKSETKPDHFESGESVHLNGYQALWYTRIRKLDSDFMRTYRQRKVITAIAENIKTELLTGNIFGVISTAKDVAPNIETSLSTTEFTSLVTGVAWCFVKSGLNLDKLLISQQLPFDDTWRFESKWDGSSIIVDFSTNQEMLYDSIYEPQETLEDTTENE